MTVHEFGIGNRETVIFLHGGGLSWWNYRREAEMLQSEYHVVLPVLDGHADSDRPFTSIENNAAEIIGFIDRYCNGKVMLIGGVSLGAQILLEILSQRKDICRYAIAESAAVIPSKLTNALIAPAFGMSYRLIKNRRFARLQFNSLHIDESLFDDYYRDTCKIGKPDMIAFLKANTSYSLKESIKESTAKLFVLAGEKETKTVLRSVAELTKRIPECTERILPGLYHGEFSLNHPEDYVDYVKKITSV
jgi:pimeloyl-ACP methyl ester carboxylesterase